MDAPRSRLWAASRFPLRRRLRRSGRAREHCCVAIAELEVLAALLDRPTPAPSFRFTAGDQDGMHDATSTRSCGWRPTGRCGPGADRRPGSSASAPAAVFTRRDLVERGRHSPRGRPSTTTSSKGRLVRGAGCCGALSELAIASPQRAEERAGRGAPGLEPGCACERAGVCRAAARLSTSTGALELHDRRSAGGRAARR
jgi:hypothetical protein